MATFRRRVSEKSGFGDALDNGSESEEPTPTSFGSDSDRLGPEPHVFTSSGIARTRVKKSGAQEKKIALRLGGRKYPASGGKRVSKYTSLTAGGDLHTAELHVEHKRVESTTKSIGLTRKWLAKVSDGARRHMKTPAMVLHYEGAEDFDEDWMLLPLELAERLLKMLRDA